MIFMPRYQYMYKMEYVNKVKQGCRLAFFQKLKDQIPKTQAIFFQNSSNIFQKLKEIWKKTEIFGNFNCT